LLFEVCFAVIRIAGKSLLKQQEDLVDSHAKDDKIWHLFLAASTSSKGELIPLEMDSTYSFDRG
jgi:hypothetical protein